MSNERWMDKENVVLIYDGVLLSHQKEWNNAICRNMNGPRHDHAEWSKPDRKDKYHMIPFIYGILKKKKIQVNLSTKHKWN